MSTTAADYRNKYEFAYWMHKYSDAVNRIAKACGIDFDGEPVPGWFTDVIPDDRHEWGSIAYRMSDAEIRARFSDLLAQSKAEEEGAI